MGGPGKEEGEGEGEGEGGALQTPLLSAPQVLWPHSIGNKWSLSTCCSNQTKQKLTLSILVFTNFYFMNNSLVYWEIIRLLRAREKNSKLFTFIAYGPVWMLYLTDPV